MKSFRRSLVLALVCLGAAASWGAVPDTLTLEDLRGHPERWPRTLVMRHEVKGPSNRWTVEKGKEVKFVELEGDKIVLEPYSDLSIEVAAADSGLVAEANALWKALTPAQRAIDHEALIADASLLPAKIKVMEELHVSNEWGQPQPGDEYDVLGYDADGLLMGAADRARRPIYVDARQTDLFEQARQRVLLPAAQRPSRLVAALQGRLVDAQGKAAEPAELGETRLFAFYYGAGWCGPCRKFSPQLVQALGAALAQNPHLTVVFLSNDKTAAAMQTYMQEVKMPWPGAELSAWSKVPLLMAYARGTVPQLVVLDRHGKVLADSFEGDRYVGPQGALQALRRQLESGVARGTARRPATGSPRAVSGRAGVALAGVGGSTTGSCRRRARCALVRAWRVDRKRRGAGRAATNADGTVGSAGRARQALSW